MKKKILLISIIGIVIIVSGFLIYAFFNGELKRTKQSITFLNAEIIKLKSDYAVKMYNIEDNLHNLTDNFNRLQSEEQQKLKALKNDLTSLQKSVHSDYSNLTRKYTALNTAQQAKNDAVSTIINTSTPAPLPAIKVPPVLDDVKVSTYFITGKQAFERGEYAKAKIAFNQLLELNPPLWEAHLYYIRAAYYENPGKAATDKTVKGLLASLPDAYREQAVKFKGLLALEKGAYGEAVAALIQYHTYRKEAESLLALGQGYLALKKQEEAEIVFKELLAGFSGTPEAHMAAKHLN